MFKGLKRKHFLWLVGQLQFWTFWRGESTMGNFNALRLLQKGDGRYGVWAPVAVVFVEEYTCMSHLYGNWKKSSEFSQLVSPVQVRYSEDLGIPLSKGSWLISYLGISSAIGRVLFGRVSDICCFKNMHIYRICMFLSGFASLLCPLASSYWALVLYVAVLGILDGSFIGLMSIVTLDIVGVHKIAPAWGILFFCQSFTYLLGPPAAGTSELATLETPQRKQGRVCFCNELRTRRSAVG